MRVIHGSEAVPPEARGAVLALGNFDGVHRGHQALISRAVTEARRSGRPAGVLLFEPHPREFFNPDAPHFRLTPLEEKLAVLDELGLDVAIVLPFDAALAARSAESFIADILVGALGVAHIVVGYHFFFGRNRGGSAETLRAAGAAHGFGVTVVEPVADRGEPYSSTAIRLALAEGDVKDAAEKLGRPWRVKGPVIGGARRGTGLGFPTANVALPKGTALGHGIFAVRVRLDDGRTLNGAAYLGTRPTFDDGMPVLEVFLFDFDEEIYGREIEVSFIDKVRDDRKFASADELVRQMQDDCAKARAILAAAPSPQGRRE
ncbi:bifunctional riboflavin kinase/FAD synthetase [Hyphomicrobium sp.]|uniref:bifunctional riboflavin kinase/FAD synthetase n=1 Tax=Hyphomicrobium sp. TaxID=82 RepID=UPI0025C0C3BB|nr:bifunctional riboflavin kinase/FAD synthetase [Hyphomicrobium sp.]MCC7250874.1 bifunctional riboflavin kinase/FAD synthetase [Hyphomicrobium sp.]